MRRCLLVLVAACGTEAPPDPNAPQQDPLVVGLYRDAAETTCGTDFLRYKCVDIVEAMPTQIRLVATGLGDTDQLVPSLHRTAVNVFTGGGATADGACTEKLEMT